jgi:hypothetical protein
MKIVKKGKRTIKIGVKMIIIQTRVVNPNDTNSDNKSPGINIQSKVKYPKSLSILEQPKVKKV